jgi:hypothetical protein
MSEIDTPAALPLLTPSSLADQIRTRWADPAEAICFFRDRLDLDDDYRHHLAAAFASYDGDLVSDALKALDGGADRGLVTLLWLVRFRLASTHDEICDLADDALEDAGGREALYDMSDAMIATVLAKGMH